MKRSILAAVAAVGFAGTAEAHYTQGRLHEHVPHMGCKVLWYTERNKPEIVALRAQLRRDGYRLYFDGHCWLKPRHGYRKMPCE